jgi:hypothetical protein
VAETLPECYSSSSSSKYSSKLSSSKYPSSSGSIPAARLAHSSEQNSSPPCLIGRPTIFSLQYAQCMTIPMLSYVESCCGPVWPATSAQRWLISTRCLFSCQTIFALVLCPRPEWETPSDGPFRFTFQPRSTAAKRHVRLLSLERPRGSSVVRKRSGFSRNLPLTTSEADKTARKGEIAGGTGQQATTGCYER